LQKELLEKVGMLVREWDNTIKDASSFFKKNCMFDIGFGSPGWMDRYYKAKFKEGLQREELANSYIEGIQWIFRYYYRGCPSFKW